MNNDSYLEPIDYHLPSEIVFRGTTHPMNTLFSIIWPAPPRLPVFVISGERLELAKESNITKESPMEEILTWVLENQWGKSTRYLPYKEIARRRDSE